MDKEKFRKILTSENISGELEDENNLKFLIEEIPEIKYMIGFKHNHPHHHLDVWGHTVLSMENSKNDYEIRLALLLHDIGKPHSYQDDEVRHFYGHADVSEEMSRNILERLEEDKDIIERISFLIKNHDILIDVDSIKDEDIEIFIKLLSIQYCDAKAHHPDKQEKRINILNDVRKKLYRKIENIKYKDEVMEK